MFVSVSDSSFRDNRATGIYGGAVFVASTDSLAATRVSFEGNVATKGGAVRVRNDLKEAGAAQGAVSFDSCSFDRNVAQFGGGIHLDGGGTVAVAATNFTANAASAAGAGVAVGDGGEFSALGSLFSGNGNSSCVAAPATGGALAVGIDDFKPYAGCSAPATIPPVASVVSSAFEGNVAVAAGGAVAVRSGSLSLSNSSVSRNAVTGLSSSKSALGPSSIDLKKRYVDSSSSSNASMAFDDVPADATADSLLTAPPAGNPSARGGGVFVGGSCGAASGSCTAANATLVDVTVSGNSAAEAGGGLFYDGTSSAASALSVLRGEIRSNRAPEGSSGGGGVGGGVALVGRGFDLSEVVVSSNAARFGGGVFVSADLSTSTASAATSTRNASLSLLSFGAAEVSAVAAASSEDRNAASRGGDVFWLRAASPSAALECRDCAFDGSVAAAAPPVASASASSSNSSSSSVASKAASDAPVGALATEAISAALGGGNAPSSPPSPSSSTPFASVQSGAAAPPFSVSLLDFYGRVSTTDEGGFCAVSEREEEEEGSSSSSSAPRVLLPDAGRRAAVAAGAALFDRFVVTGGIGTQVPLKVECSPSPATGKPSLLSRVPSPSNETSSTATTIVAVPLSLPDLPLVVAVAECGRGTQAPPATTSSTASYPVCSPCAFGTYSFDGGSSGSSTGGCKPCREGALCPGGVQG